MLTSKVLKNLLFLLLTLFYLSQIGIAGEQIVLSPGEGHSNQIRINQALEEGDVYLKAGVYEVDNTIIIGSNRVFTGDKNAIIRVWSGSSQWFTGATGVISCKESVQNVEICGFQMDGNIGNLDKALANSRSDTRHDCEKLIILGGYSNQFAKNIKIHDMTFYNSFSDAIYIRFTENVKCYNNFISNCQHEGIYYSVVKNGHLSKNKIAGITSDCARLDNCMDCLIDYNLFFSYTGESYGAYKGGQSGLQIGDAGSSMGYNAVKPNWHTTNIEVCYNTFADPGLKAIWLDAAGQTPSTNFFAHDNEFIDAAGLETMGIPVGNISEDNQPTLEMSKEVFSSSIFDILNVTFVNNATTKQTAEDFNYQIQETEQGKVAGGIKIVGFNSLIKIENQTYISSPDDVIVKTSIIKNPSLGAWNGGIQSIDKDVNITFKNGTVNATLTAKVKWYNMKRTPNGEEIKKYKTSEYIFTDTYSPAPEVLKQPEHITGIIYQYPTYFTLKVPSNGLTKICYEYAGKKSEHTLLVGSKNVTSNGTKLTEYSELEYWKGDLRQQADWVQIPGKLKQNKLNVTAYTPYKEVKVTYFKIIKKEVKEDPIAWWFKPSIGLLVILFFYLKREWDEFRRT